MANKKKVSPANIKKIVGEIILIPLCILYLYYTLLFNAITINKFILHAIIFITCVQFIIKYIHEVYVYESKTNPLKIVFIIFNILLSIACMLNIILKVKVIRIVFIVLVIIMLCYLLYNAITKIINIIKSKGILYKNAFSSFLSLIAFFMILMGLVIYLK